MGMWTFPADLDECCQSLITLWIRRRDRIGRLTGWEIWHSLLFSAHYVQLTWMIIARRLRLKFRPSDKDGWPQLDASLLAWHLKHATGSINDKVEGLHSRMASCSHPMMAIRRMTTQVNLLSKVTCCTTTSLHPYRFRFLNPCQPFKEFRRILNIEIVINMNQLLGYVQYPSFHPKF